MVTSRLSSPRRQLTRLLFALMAFTESADLAAMPSFSQEELDAQPKTAPVD